MQRCPNCRSRKFYGSKKLGWRCRNCGYTNIPENIRKSMHKPNNDMGIINKRIESNTIMNSSLFSRIHDLHNIAFRFKVNRFPASIDLKRQQGFKGNVYRFSYKGKNIMLSRNWLIIYNKGRNKMSLRNLPKAEADIRAELIALAKEISAKYEFTIDDNPILFAKNKPEVKTSFTSAVNFIEPEAKAVYTAPSPIELTGKDAVKNAMNLSAMIVNLNDSVNLFRQEIRTHIRATERWEKAADRIANVSKPEGLTFQSFTSRIGFWLSNLKLKTISRLFRVD